jgi:FlaA1/EpsC-like NDP-sugar epimerase
MKTIMIVGASGVFGSRLVEQLAAVGGPEPTASICLMSVFRSRPLAAWSIIAAG